MRNEQLGRLGVAMLCASAYVVASQTTSPQVVPQHALKAGTRVLLDAHNANVENGGWSDRLDRALATGLPMAIEQDLVWVPASSDAPGRSVVSHGPPVSGSEPTLEEYFFKRIAPLVEQALRENRRDLWPVITLNLHLKTDEPEHHQAVWDVLGRYEKWLVTAQRTAAGEIAPLRSAPLLVLTGEADAQEKSFHDKVPTGGTLRLWIRFYTLNGHDPADASMGWTPGYNFGTLDAVRIRWAAAVRAGVDFVATDQYEAFATARQ